MNTLDRIRMPIRDAAPLLPMPTGTYTRLARSFALSRRSERSDLELASHQTSGQEIIRAAAYMHFRASGARPDERTGEWLRQQHFAEGPWVVVLRNEGRSAIVVDTTRLLRVITEPGVYSVWDPSPLLERLAVPWESR